ncbi:hypothetical protein GCM10023216_28330 [Isoptericola chiayiensis]|uniref:Uncharacterized protein n=1 Tax=Isoptericola chiayiensis TaxID=579446 RepID=A0ABP8YPP8_9MICO
MRDDGPSADVLGARRQVLDQAGLAHAGVATDHQHARVAVRGAFERTAEALDLRLARDEGDL